MQDQAIFIALETIGALCPWEQVEIWTRRKPNGEISFTLYLQGNSDFGLSGDCNCGSTLADCIAYAQQVSEKRKPETFRQKKLEELRRQIQTLENLRIESPPYRPGTRLALGALETPIEV